MFDLVDFMLVSYQTEWEKKIVGCCLDGWHQYQYQYQ
jgi:hypothetical protein